jgi:outer membrane PBP1 activator LpoA protein
MLLIRFTATLPRALQQVLFTVVLMSGCQQSPTLLQPDDLYDPAAQAADYLTRLRQSQDHDANTWRLLAIRALLQEGQLAQAIQQFQALPPSLTAEQHQEQQLLAAAIALEQRDPIAATKPLNALASSLLPTQQQCRYYQLRYTLAKLQQDPVAEVVALMALQPLLPQPAQAVHCEQTWRKLMALSTTELQSIASMEPSAQLKGWLALLAIYHTTPPLTQQLKEAITEWRQQYPTHPATRQLPAVIIQQLQLQPLKLHKIGLLLPMSGPAAPFGQSIYQGFMDAARPAISTPSLPELGELLLADGATDSIQTEIVTYDTTTQPIQTLLTQAQRDQVSLLVGPLLKQEVEQLNQLKVPLPLLALNVPQQQPSPQRSICYYGLTPSDEAQDAARHLWHQKKQQPLVLAPQSPLGEQAAQSFQHKWKQLSGYKPAVHYFAPVTELKRTINHLSKRPKPAAAAIPPERSEETLEELSLLTLFPNQDNRFEENLLVRDPPSIDAVYMVTTPEEFTLLKSLLDMAITTADKRPALYASSRSFNSTICPDLRLEMEGLQFGDIPLLVTQQPLLVSQQATKRFNRDFSLIRLYAMGHDAWLLASHFEELLRLPYFRLSGTTGILKADSHGIIHRQLTWARYYQGQRLLVP